MTMTNAVQTPAPTNAIAHKARVSAEILIPLLFAAITLPLIGQVYLAIFEPPPGALPALNAVLAHLIRGAPSLIIAFSMLGIAKVLREYEQGRYVSLSASAEMKRIGTGGLIALILNALIAPALIAALRGEPIWPALNPGPFDLSIMIFASFTLTLGGVLEDAAKQLKAENDQIV